MDFAESRLSLCERALFHTVRGEIGLFTDAKSAEDEVEDVVGVDGADDLAECV